MRSNGLTTLGLLGAVVSLLPTSLLSQEVTELPGTDRELTVNLADEYSVGSVAGEDWEMFSTISGVSFDQEGNLYLMDRQNFRVVKVDAQGKFVAEMGRAGGGPGEFGMPIAFAVTHEGELRVFDMGHQGFTVFNPDGTFQRTVPLGGGEMFVPNGGLMSLPNGDIVDGGVSGFGLMVMGDSEDTPAPRPVHRFKLGDEAEVSAAYEAWNPLSVVGPQRDETVSGGGIQVTGSAMRAFDPGLYVGVLPNGQLAVADSTTYTIKVVDPQGGLVRVLRRPFSPKAVTRGDRAAERERQLALIDAREESSGGSARAFSSDGGGSRAISVGGGQVSELLRARVEGMQFGEEIPVVAGMAVDWDGRIWVERTGQRVGEDGPIDLIGTDGRYLGSVDPQAFTIPDAFGPGGLVAYIETDELDVPRVVVKRLSVS